VAGPDWGPSTSNLSSNGTSLNAALQTGAAIAAALAPFLPAILQLVWSGLGTASLAGDAASFELGVRRATHLEQLLGPYSRFGWSHPGPTSFYLAVPFYYAFGEHSGSLNVFALTIQIASAVSIVLLAKRLGGFPCSLGVAGVMAILEVRALPYLIGNVWNPILPILPLALLCIVAASVKSGDHNQVVWLAPLSSGIVQTHIGFTLPVLGVCAYAAYALRSGRPRRQQTQRPVVIASLITLAMWMPPLSQAVRGKGGNVAQSRDSSCPTIRRTTLGGKRLK
jgi:hypothetical protein